MKLQKKLFDKYKFYYIDYLKDNNDFFILDISNSYDRLVMRCVYIILGSYYITDNIWYWASASLILDKRLIKKNILLRKKILKKINTIKQVYEFIKKTKIIITLELLINYINFIEKFIEKYILMVKKTDKIYNFFLIEKTLINNF